MSALPFFLGDDQVYRDDTPKGDFMSMSTLMETNDEDGRQAFIRGFTGHMSGRMHFIAATNRQLLELLIRRLLSAHLRTYWQELKAYTVLFSLRISLMAQHS